MTKTEAKEKALRKLQDLANQLSSKIPEHSRMNEKEVCVDIRLISETGCLETHSIRIYSDRDCDQDTNELNQNLENSWF